MKIARGECLYTSTYGISCPDITDDELEEGEEFLMEWLNDYIDFMAEYTDELSKDDDRLLNLVYWTPVKFIYYA